MRAFLIALLALSACTLTPAPELPPPDLPQRAGVDPIVAARAAGVETRIVSDDYVIDIMRENEIVLTRDNTREVFPKREPQTPRWSGAIYTTRNGARDLVIYIRDYRPCVRADRASYPIQIDVILDGVETTACGVRL